MMRRRLAAGFAAALIATGIAATTGEATASAAQFQRTSTGVNVWLTHAETVQVARSGLANYLENPEIRQKIVGVNTSEKSRYYSKLHTLPGHGKLRYSTERYQTLINETASHPTGRVGIFITPPASPVPIIIAQYWK